MAEQEGPQAPLAETLVQHVRRDRESSCFNPQVIAKADKSRAKLWESQRFRAKRDCGSQHPANEETRDRNSKWLGHSHT